MPATRRSVAPGPRRRPRRALAGAAAVLSAALLPVVLVLPATAARADEPAAVSVVGELVQAWVETDGHGPGAAHAPAPVSWVETAAGDAVPVASDDVADLPPGATVSVTLGGEPIAGGGAAHPVLEAEVLGTPPAVEAAPAGPLTHQVTVVMVAPAGTPEGPRASRQQFVDLVDGPVAEFWSAETGGAISLGVTSSHDWISTSAGCGQPGELWTEAAARVGFVAGPGRHLLVVVPPSAPGCSYALAEVGSSRTSGGRLYVSDASSSLIAHELGHNFGLAHSSAAQCDAAVDSGSCRTVAYRDHYDVMGVSWARTGSLNVVQAAALGVLPDEQVQEVPAQAGATTVTLAPVSGRSGTRAARLTDAAGVEHWLEYRPAAGRDAWLGTAADPFGLDAGVLLRRAGAFPDTSVLLDGTPSAAAGWDADLRTALPLGSPVSISGGRFTVEVRALTAEGAVVSVVPSPPPVAPGAPAPPAADPAPGAVLPGWAAAPAADAPAVAPAARPASSAVDLPGQAPVAAPAEPAAQTVPTGGAEPSPAAATEAAGGSAGFLLVAGLGSALLAATALVVRGFRRAAAR